MVIIVSALYIEAKPIIEYYSLKKDVLDKYFQVFKNDDIVLIITGVGKINSSIAVSHLLTKYILGMDDIILNIGICGTKDDNINIGNIFLINRIKDNETKRDFYPDILIEHPFEESDIETFSYPVVKPGLMSAKLCDMESSGFYQAASKYMQTHQIYLLKIVSDRIGVDTIDKNLVYNVVKNNMDKIDKFINTLKSMFKEQKIFSDEEQKIISDIIKKLKLTLSQQHILYKSCLHFKVRTGNSFLFLKDLAVDNVNNKNEREKRFAEILTYLR